MAAVAVVALAVAAYVAGAVGRGQVDVFELLYGGMVLAFGSTGLVITRRVRGNVIGPMFLGTALAAGAAEASRMIAERGSELGMAYGSASWVPVMLPTLVLLPALFPDGRPLPGHWRWLVRAGLAGMAVVFTGVLLRPGPLEDHPAVDNPIGMPALAGLDGLGFLPVVVAMFGGLVSLVLRYRRAGGTERLQIRWLALAGAGGAVAFVLGLVLLLALPGRETPLYVMMMLGVLALPAAAAVAMVRYRLYDVDVVVNRALVYSGLTATLATTYLASVLLLQVVLPTSSDLAVAASTLAAAAVVRPARARIQSAVDRRFFRRRYDAARTLLHFGARLRDEVDLAAIQTELIEVAAGTVEPGHVSLWLRER